LEVQDKLEKMLNQKNITLVMGGPGSEREVSLASGKGVSEALQSLGAHVTEVDVTGPDFQIPAGTEVVFNVIHGTFGEDGTLQRILESKGIPYTGAGIVSSELAFDKVPSKVRFVEKNVPTPKYQIVPLPAGPEAVTLPLPLCVKPPRQGSSVGVHIVHDTTQLAAALTDCAQYGHEALVEELIVGKELTVGILGDRALPIIHIQPRSGFYDISNKYPWMNNGTGGSDYYCPADLSPATTARVQAAALAAHRALGIEVYSRVDVLLDAAENAYVLEVNTIPGMTSSSLLPKAARAVGIEYPELCARIIQLSLALKR
jgi:D-alanine-D-alanine ligase